MSSPQIRSSDDEHTIPKILHFVVPVEPSPAQMEVIDRARLAHSQWSVRVWSDRTEFPDSILSTFLEKCKSGAQRADLIRLQAVFREGGVYLDSDMRVLR